MICPNCGRILDDKVSECECGWKSIQEQTNTNSNSSTSESENSSQSTGQNNTSNTYSEQPKTQTVYVTREAPGYNGMAIGGFVCSFFVPIIGLILSACASSQIKKTGEQGEGLATAGIIISIIELCISLLYSFIACSVIYR